MNRMVGTKWWRRFRNGTLLGAIVCRPSDCTDIGRAIEDLGFTPLSPPSTSAGPGSMVYIRQEHPLRIGMICSVRHSLGSNFVPREHRTSQPNFERTRLRHFALSADVMNQVKAETSLHSIKSVCVTLANPKIYRVDDTDVLDNTRFRSKICKRAIENRIASNFRVTMVSESLEGDVTYTVTWDTQKRLSAHAKVDLLTNLKVKLRLNDAEVRGNSIVGRALIWGVIDDRWLAQSSMAPRPASDEAPSFFPVELKAAPPDHSPDPESCYDPELPGGIYSSCEPEVYE